MARDPNEAVYGHPIGGGLYLNGPRWGGKKYFNSTTSKNQARFAGQAAMIAACHFRGTPQEEKYLTRAKDMVALFAGEERKEGEWEQVYAPWEALWASLFQQAGARPTGRSYWYDCGRIQRPHDRGQLDTPWPGEEVA